MKELDCWKKIFTALGGVFLALSFADFIDLMGRGYFSPAQSILFVAMTALFFVAALVLALVAAALRELERKWKD